MPNFFGGMSGPNGNPFANMIGLTSMFGQFMNNPVGALMNMGINVPRNLQNGNNAEALVNYLRNSGQMNEQQFNHFSNLAQQFQGMLGGMGGFGNMNGSGNQNGMNGRR